MSEFDPAGLERGYSGWASSEDDGGPDVGHFIGLGDRAWLWIGEIPDAEHARLSEEHRAIGDAGGWWVVMHTSAGERLTLGRAVPGYGGDTSEFIESLCAILRAPPSLRDLSEPPKGFGELPPIEMEGGFRMPTEKEFREGLGPHFKPDAPRERSEHGTDESSQVTPP